MSLLTVVAGDEFRTSADQTDTFSSAHSLFALLDRVLHQSYFIVCSSFSNITSLKTSSNSNGILPQLKIRNHNLVITMVLTWRPRNRWPRIGPRRLASCYKQATVFRLLRKVMSWMFAVTVWNCQCQCQEHRFFACLWPWRCWNFVCNWISKNIQPDHSCCHQGLKLPPNIGVPLFWYCCCWYCVFGTKRVFVDERGDCQSFDAHCGWIFLAFVHRCHS